MRRSDCHNSRSFCRKTCAAAGVTEFTDGGSAGRAHLRGSQAPSCGSHPQERCAHDEHGDATPPRLHGSRRLPRLAGRSEPDQCRGSARHAGGECSRPLLEVPPAPLRHLEIVEQARPALDFVQNRFAQRYASRPLPPISQEDETLRVVLNLWQLMLRSYALIAQRSALDPSFLDRRPLLAQRRLHYHGALILEYYRARRETPPGIWAELHRPLFRRRGMERCEGENRRTAQRDLARAELHRSLSGGIVGRSGQSLRENSARIRVDPELGSTLRPALQPAQGTSILKPAPAMCSISRATSRCAPREKSRSPRRCAGSTTAGWPPTSRPSSPSSRTEPLRPRWASATTVSSRPARGC